MVVIGLGGGGPTEGMLTMGAAAAVVREEGVGTEATLLEGGAERMLLLALGRGAGTRPILFGTGTCC